MITSYPFTKAVQTLQLENEIKASAIVTAIQSIVLNGTNDLNVSFKDALSVGDEAILNALVSAHVPIALIDEPMLVQMNVPTTVSGIPKMAAYEPEGSSATIVTFNLVDKCSWYVMSVQVLLETATTSDNLIYSSVHPFWIDMVNGRCYDEDNIMLLSGNKYAVKVYIDDVLQTSGFTINHVEGKVTFSATVSGVVKFSYHYATTSYYKLRPNAGKKMTIKTAEVQFSTDMTMTSPILFEPWFVGHPVYGSMAIPGQAIAYKNMKDFISACNGGQGLIPKIGELVHDVHVFPFDYARPKPIKYSDYVEIRVYIKNHEPMVGEFATGTFYVAIDNE